MRLFVALDVSPDSRAELQRRAAELRRVLPAARWVDLSGAHLTLVFLGEVGEAHLPSLGRALDTAFASHAPMELQVVGGGSFPPARTARVVWAGVAAPPGLAALQEDLALALADAVGYVPENRPFHPHVTVARCDPPWPRAAADRFAEAFADAVAPPFRVEDGVLMRSTLGRGGARYEVVSRHPLRGAP